MPHRQLPRVDLYCHAPHPDPRKPYALCRTLLGMGIPGAYVPVNTIDRRPAQPDPEGLLWLQCPRKSCGKWNAFRLVPIEASVR